jgi:anti-sigma factor RsiW
MNCNEAAALTAAYHDGELDPAQSRALEQHLLGCTACAARRDELSTLRARLRREAPYHAAPRALRDRIAAALPASVPLRAAPLRGQRWRWLSAGAFAGAAATVFAWMLGTALLETRDADALAAEAVADHVRATLGKRTIEVASSDQHTVKPWLSSQLDFSPPVKSQVGDGFTLVGARLDYLDRHPVATLVYRYRQHGIDVFVRPATRASHAVPPVTVRGFNVSQAIGTGMEWWAVSDVAPDVLAAFVLRLAHDETQ